MSPQSVMSRKKASYSPGMSPIEGKKFSPGTQTGSRDKFPSLSLGVTKTSPLSPVLVDQPATGSLCKSRLETPRAGLGPRNLREEPPLASPSAISLPANLIQQGNFIDVFLARHVSGT